MMYFRQPAYFNDFRCIGSDCQFSCCKGWRIDWKTEEIEKIKNAPSCSDELRALIEESFIKSDIERVDYVVKHKEDKRCPFLTEDGLCRIQKELGEEYLSHTCSIYPRKYRLALDINTESYTHMYRFCDLSCPEIAKRLVTDKKAMSLINVPSRKKTIIQGVNTDNEDVCEEHPEYLFRADLFEFFYGLISDKKFSVETAILHGVIAAGILTDIVKEKNYAAIPQAIVEIREGFLKGNMFRELDNIKPDYKVKVGFVGGVIQNIIGQSTMNILKTQDGKLDLALYLKGERQLSQMFDGDDFWLRNIALNLLFELSIPFYSTQYTILESYSLFTATYACFKFNAVASVSSETPGIELEIAENYSAKFKGMDRVWGFASIISRSLCQNVEKSEKLVQALKDAKLTTPGQLALLIK